LTARRLLAVLFFISLFAMSVRETIDPDLWWHLATGRYIVETRSIPRHDVFSYTVPEHRWITHEWLTQVLMYGVYRLLGLPGLMLAAAGVITLTFGLVYAQCAGRPHLAVFVVLLAALASAVTWGARPQMVNMLMAAGFTWVLRQNRRTGEWRIANSEHEAHEERKGHRGHNRWLRILPLLMALWVNMHSGFFLGFVLMGVAWVGEVLHISKPSNLQTCQPSNLLTFKPSNLLISQSALFPVILLSILASLLNPNTYRMLLYPFGTLGSQAMQRYIQEWHSPNFHRPEYWPFALLLLGTAAVLALGPRLRHSPAQDHPGDRTIPPTPALPHRERETNSLEGGRIVDLLWFLGFGAAGLISARHIPLFAVVAPPLVTHCIRDWGQGARDKGQGTREKKKVLPSTVQPSNLQPVLNWVLLFLAVLAAGGWIAGVIARNDEAIAQRYPVQALEYVEAHGLADKRVYNSYNWGGYLLWRGYPVFIDGRADVYGDEFIYYYLQTYQLQGDWRRPLDDYGVDYVLIESTASLGTLLREAQDWQEVYRDEVAVVFVNAKDTSTKGTKGAKGPGDWRTEKLEDWKIGRLRDWETGCWDRRRSTKPNLPTFQLPNLPIFQPPNLP